MYRKALRFRIIRFVQPTMYKRQQCINISIRRVQCTTIWFSRPPPSRMSQCLQGKHCFKIFVMTQIKDVKDQTKWTNRRIRWTSHFLQSSRQNGQRFKSLWGVGLCRTLELKNTGSIACRLLYLVQATTLLHWVTFSWMFISDVSRKYTGLVYFLYYVCSWLYYTGTFVVMCLNTCDRKHLQTWNNFTFVGNNQLVSFILIVETKVSENFSLQTLLKRGIYIFIV